MKDPQSVRLGSLAAATQRQAIIEKKTVSQIIRQALAEYLGEHEPSMDGHHANLIQNRRRHDEC